MKIKEKGFPVQERIPVLLRNPTEHLFYCDDCGSRVTVTYQELFDIYQSKYRVEKWMSDDAMEQSIVSGMQYLECPVCLKERTFYRINPPFWKRWFK